MVNLGGGGGGGGRLGGQKPPSALELLQIGSFNRIFFFFFDKKMQYAHAYKLKKTPSQMVQIRSFAFQLLGYFKVTMHKVWEEGREGGGIGVEK